MGLSKHRHQRRQRCLSAHRAILATICVYLFAFTILSSSSNNNNTGKNNGGTFSPILCAFAQRTVDVPIPVAFLKGNFSTRPTNNLIASYTFEEATGTSSADLSAAQTGAISFYEGQPEWLYGSEGTTGVLFNPKTAMSTSGDSTLNNLINGAVGLSLELWMSSSGGTTELSSLATIASKTSTPSTECNPYGPIFGLWRDTSGSKVYFRPYGRTYDIDCDLMDGVVPISNAVQHHVIVMGASPAYYINGVLARQGADFIMTQSVANSFDMAFVLGSGGLEIPHKIYQAALYNTTLSESEIVALFDAGLPNQKPTAYPMNLTVVEDTSLEFVLRGSDPDNQTIECNLHSLPSSLGTLYLVSTGSEVSLASGNTVFNQSEVLRFVPFDDFCGTTTLDYTVSEIYPYGGTTKSSSVGTVTVNVVCVPDPPLINNQTHAVFDYEFLNLTVSGNDSHDSVNGQPPNVLVGKILALDNSSIAYLNQSIEGTFEVGAGISSLPALVSNSQRAFWFHAMPVLGADHVDATLSVVLLDDAPTNNVSAVATISIRISNSLTTDLAVTNYTTDEDTPTNIILSFTNLDSSNFFDRHICYQITKAPSIGRLLVVSNQSKELLLLDQDSILCTDNEGGGDHTSGFTDVIYDPNPNLYGIDSFEYSCVGVSSSIASAHLLDDDAVVFTPALLAAAGQHQLLGKSAPATIDLTVISIYDPMVFANLTWANLTDSDSVDLNITIASTIENDNITQLKIFDFPSSLGVLMHNSAAINSFPVLLDTTHVTFVPNCLQMQSSRSGEFKVLVVNDLGNSSSEGYVSFTVHNSLVTYSRSLVMDEDTELEIELEYEDLAAVTRSLASGEVVAYIGDVSPSLLSAVNISDSSNNKLISANNTALSVGSSSIKFSPLANVNGNFSFTYYYAATPCCTSSTTVSVPSTISVYVVPVADAPEINLSAIKVYASGSEQPLVPSIEDGSYEVGEGDEITVKGISISTADGPDAHIWVIFGNSNNDDASTVAVALASSDATPATQLVVNGAASELGADIENGITVKGFLSESEPAQLIIRAGTGSDASSGSRDPSSTASITIRVTPSSSNVGKVVGTAVGISVGVLVIVAIIAIVLIVVASTVAALKIKRDAARRYIELSPDFEKIAFGAVANNKLSKSELKYVNTKLKPLEDMLLRDDQILVSAVATSRVDRIDPIIAPLTFLFEHHGKTMELLRYLIFQEVRDKKTAPATLFRANSMASKVVKQYTNIVGLEYLYNTISPGIKEILSSNISLQVIQHKMTENDDVNANTWQLMAVVQKIFVSITKSLDNCPMQMRYLCYLLGKAVKEVFGDFEAESAATTTTAAAAEAGAASAASSTSSDAANVNNPKNIAHNVVSGIMFLRFFCAAITTPHEYGIVQEQPEGEARDRLINVSKVITNLANQTRFGNKEQGLLRINEFIDTNMPVIRQFYDSLMAEPPKEASEASLNSSVRLPQGLREASLVLLHGYVIDNREAIEEQLSKRTDAAAVKLKSDFLAFVAATANRRLDNKDKELNEV